MTLITRSDQEDLEFLRGLKNGDTVIMMNPGLEHLDEWLYVGSSVKILSVEGRAESRDVFLFVEGRKTGVSIGCFPERVDRGPSSNQMELF